MKKKLNINAIESELKESVFFPHKEESVTHLPTELPEVKEQQNAEEHDTVVSRYHDTMIPRNHDTVVPENTDGMLEEVRKAVRQVGKEAATQRLTLEEKQTLADIEYTYIRQGIKTSSNEMIRIAINYIVREYKKNGEKSILAEVLHKLNS